MDFNIPDDVMELKLIFRKFVREELMPLEDEMEKNQKVPPEILKKMGEMKLFGLTIPKEYGGLGLSSLGFCVISEEFAYAHPGLRTLITLPNSLGSKPILLGGSEEQKKKYLPKVASGEYMPAFGLTEPGAGSDAVAIKTTAIKKGNTYILNGLKHFISHGAVADFVITFAYTDKSAGAKGITAFIVEKGTKGFSIGKIQETLGGLEKNFSPAELIFEDAEVPEENVLGKPGEGFTLSLRTLADGRLALGGFCLGFAERLLELSIDYAKKRIQFAKPLVENQAIQWYLAESATELFAARMLVYSGAYKRDLGQRVVGDAAEAKLLATEMVSRVVDRSLQIFGGRGFLNDYPIDKLFRAIRVLRIIEGTSEIQRMIIARELLS